MRKIILLLLLQCSLAAVGQEKPKIFFSNKTIDLGIIPSEKTPCVSVNFIFSNKGKTPLVIYDVKASCGCTVPTWPKAPIKPDGKSLIKVDFETKKQQLYLQPIITQYFIDNKSEIWLLFLIAHSKR